MNRLFFIFFFTCFLLTGSFAQKNSTIDSLINLIKIAKEDSSKVLLLIRAGQEFESDHQDIAKEYYQQAKKLSENIHYLRGILKFTSNYTYILNTENKIDSSIELNLLGVKLAREINDREYLGKSLVNTGMSYFNNQDYVLAFKYVNEGRTILEKLFDESDIAIIYDQLQVICLGLKQYDRAITYGKKAVSLFEKTDNKYGLTTALNNLGTIYDRKMQYNLAEEYFKKAYKLAVRENDLLLESTVLLNLTDIDIKLFRLDELPSKVKRILEISNQINIPVNKAIALRALGIYYLNKMNFKESYKYLDSSLKLAKIAGSREHTRKALEVQSNLFYAMHDFKKAENILSISDSIAMTEINENIHKITLDLEKKYETEKNLATIELQKSKLRNRRNLNFIFGGTAVALAVISLLLFFNYKQSQRIQKQKIIELENQKNLQSTKAVLKGEEQERSRLAKDLHDGLSGMLSGVKYSLQDMKGNLILTEENQLAFERSMDMLDSSIKEFRRVAHIMMPEV
ncbi:MAG TPA: tetratricopeptide repeat protein, partial [Niabella sp.]|nr:tetratricopeptide repeat protein [Niabella sp.]